MSLFGTYCLQNGQQTSSPDPFDNCNLSDSVVIFAEFILKLRSGTIFDVLCRIVQ